MNYSILGMRTLILATAGIISLMMSYSSPGQKTAAGWMYNYAFDGNAYDIGPNRMHGQMVGGVTAAPDRFGRAGKALSFNGVDGFIRIPFSSASKNLPTANFAFTVWLYVDKYNTSPFWDELKTDKYSPVFCKTETSTAFQYRLGVADQGFYFDGGEEGSSKGLYTSNGVTLVPGKWNMFAVTFNGYVAKYFLNGHLIACENIGAKFLENNQPLIVGCDFPGQASYFSGKMDDFSIWEKFITEDEVKQIFAVQSKYPFIPPNITVPPAEPVVVAPDTTTKTIVKVAPPAPKDSIKPTITKKDSIPSTAPKQEVFEVKKGDKIVLRHVLFVQSKAEFLPESYKELDQLVATLNQQPQITIEVSGHTDNQGNRDLNIELSEERAEKVKDYLVTHGIDGKRINVKGYGPDKPISPNDTEEHRRLNRRVEFEIIQM
ncbi:OmpA family protein [Flavobacterium sp.]|uniref:OmpA family protein n=1 Tax=Flavobacterium sp. TaxID=239 RepID=UPI0025C1BF9D|nr:OmpA family protein [Flavobacterium sp.]